MDEYFSDSLHLGILEAPAEEPDLITETARRYFGVPYLYPYQRLVVHSILEGAGIFGAEEKEEANPYRIVILPTGAGKSLCFTLPALLMDKTTLIMYPLLGLMADQERRLIKSGIGCGLLKGGLSAEEREKVWKNTAEGKIKVLLSNPETLLSPPVYEKLAALDIGHLVVDETHTVSEWGDTFRPSYLKASEIIKQGRIPQVTAFTATASPRILGRLKEILFPGENPSLVFANPDRPNISYKVIPALSKTRELVKILGNGTSGKPAIVFCRSRTGAELTAEVLRNRLHCEEIFFYHAGLSREEKKAVEEWFFSSDTGILTATCAYGMGVDKSNVRLVVHRDVPPSVESYLQESGRGGRDKEPAKAVLLVSPEDFTALDRYPEGQEKESYRKMLLYARERVLCRREFLLALLGAVPENCEGCDICAGDVQEEPEGAEEFRRLIKLSGGVPSLAVLAALAKGSMARGGLELGLWRHRQFGILRSWEEAEINEALDAYKKSGALTKRSFRRRGIRVNRKKLDLYKISGT